MRSHQFQVAAQVPDKKIDYFLFSTKVFQLTKTILLIIRDQLRHLVVITPHSKVLSLTCIPDVSLIWSKALQETASMYKY